MDPWFCMPEISLLNANYGIQSNRPTRNEFRRSLSLFLTRINNGDVKISSTALLNFRLALFETIFNFTHSSIHKIVPDQLPFMPRSLPSSHPLLRRIEETKIRASTISTINLQNYDYVCCENNNRIHNDNEHKLIFELTKIIFRNISVSLTGDPRLPTKMVEELVEIYGEDMITVKSETSLSNKLSPTSSKISGNGTNMMFNNQRNSLNQTANSNPITSIYAYNSYNSYDSHNSYGSHNSSNVRYGSTVEDIHISSPYFAQPLFKNDANVILEFHQDTMKCMELYTSFFIFRNDNPFISNSRIRDLFMSSGTERAMILQLTDEYERKIKELNEREKLITERENQFDEDCEKYELELTTWKSQQESKYDRQDFELREMKKLFIRTNESYYMLLNDKNVITKSDKSEKSNKSERLERLKKLRKEKNRKMIKFKNTSTQTPTQTSTHLKFSSELDKDLSEDISIYSHSEKSCIETLSDKDDFDAEEYLRNLEKCIEKDHSDSSEKTEKSDESEKCSSHDENAKDILKKLEEEIEACKYEDETNETDKN